jgi:hypothetical protein
MIETRHVKVDDLETRLFWGCTSNLGEWNSFLGYEDRRVGFFVSFNLAHTVRFIPSRYIPTVSICRGNDPAASTVVNMPAYSVTLEQHGEVVKLPWWITGNSTTVVQSLEWVGAEILETQYTHCEPKKPTCRKPVLSDRLSDLYYDIVRRSRLR